MLATYPEIRDRIYELARQHELRVYWVDSTQSRRDLLLYDAHQVVVARAMVPVRGFGPRRLRELSDALEDVFGKGWME